MSEEELMEITELSGAHGKKLFSISGTIDDTANFTKLNDNIGALHVDLHDVKRINSVGIKKWMIFFEGLHKSGTEIFFHRIAPTIVEQMVNISNFNCGGTVVSVVLPFVCRACKAQNSIVKSKEDIKGIDLDKAPWPCQSCKKTELEFDDLADEYLSFWER